MIVTLLLLLAGGGEPAPPPEPPPERAASRTIRVRTYDAAGGAIEEWTGTESVECTFELFGPGTATVVHPIVVNGVLNPALHRSRLLPDGRAVFVEIDARALGVPDVWLGRLKSAPGGSGSAAMALQCQGPHAWLSRAPVPAQVDVEGAAGRIFADVVEASSADLRLERGVVHEGPSVPVDLSGGSVWDLASALHELTGERLWLTAIPGEARLRYDWIDPLGGVEDRRGEVVLEEGTNAEWDADNDLDPEPAALLIAGGAFDGGVAVRGAGAEPPSGPVFGQRAALQAIVGSLAADQLVGAGGIEARPDLTALGALIQQAETAARRGMYLPITASARITDPDLWQAMRIGTLVSCRFRSDPLGLFHRSVAIVQQVTWGIEPQTTCDVGLELWALEDRS